MRKSLVPRRLTLAPEKAEQLVSFRVRLERRDVLLHILSKKWPDVY
jgi:hypothetical protein